MSAICSFLRARGGNFAVTFALVAVPAMMVAALALEFSQVYSRQNRLQNAIDAATLAAGNELPSKSDTQVLQEIRDFLEANLDAADYSQMHDLQVAVDRSRMTLVVSAAGTMETSLANVAGISSLDYHVSASIQAAWGAIEAALVLDNTGSMSVDGKLDSLKAVADDFIEGLLNYNVSGTRVRIGLVPFSEYVNVGTGNANASWLETPVPDGWEGCVGSRSGTLDLDDTTYSEKIPPVVGVNCASALTDLSTNKSLLKSRIGGMVAIGNTYIPSGLAWGQRMLSSKAPLTAASTAAVAEQDRITKAIVLMTDGENTISANPLTPYHDGYDKAATDAATATLCENIKTGGVSLFTITFGNSVPAGTQALMSSCSSGPGYYFDANTSGDLRAAFDDIARKLTRLYLTH